MLTTRLIRIRELSSMSSRVSMQFGFTMLELVVVVAISALLAVMGLPLLDQFKQNSSAEAVQSEFAKSLESARELAVSGGKSVYVCASSDGKKCSAAGWERGWLVYQGLQRKSPGEIIPQNEIVQYFDNGEEKLPFAVVDETLQAISDIRFNSQGFNSADQRVMAVTCGANNELSEQAVYVERTGRVHLNKTATNTSLSKSNPQSSNLSCTQV